VTVGDGQVLQVVTVFGQLDHAFVLNVSAALQKNQETILIILKVYLKAVVNKHLSRFELKSNYAKTL
jgi:hypothetical protein